MDGQLCGSGHRAGEGLGQSVCAERGARPRRAPRAQLQPGSGERRGSPPREGERGPARWKGARRALPEEPLLKQRPGSVGAWGVKLGWRLNFARARSAEGWPGSHLHGAKEEAWLQTTAGRRPVAGVGRSDGPGFDGRSAHGTEGPASRGDARGSDGRRGPGETGGGRSQNPAEEGRGHGSSFRELSLAEGQRRSSHPEAPDRKSVV